MTTAHFRLSLVCKFSNTLLMGAFLVGVTFHSLEVHAQACPSTEITNGVTVTNTCTLTSGTFTIDVGGAISAGSNASIQVNSGPTVDSISNSGAITGGAGIWNNYGTITTLTNTNTGTIAGSGGDGIFNQDGTITTLTNTGTITGSGGFGIDNTHRGTITTLTNTGTITGTGFGIYNSGTITTLTNTGTIGGIINQGFMMPPTIATLNNSQGASSSALAYTGALPTNYNIIVNSPTSFGQLSASSISGSLTFGIDASSTLTNNTYTTVLSGLSSSYITNYSSIYNAWTSFNSSYKWELVSGINSTTWNLVVAPLATNILSGSTNLLSNVGSTLNPILDGGVLKMDVAGPNSTAFSITANNGTINQNSTAANLSGNITNSAGSVNGKLTITNPGSTTGSVTLSGTNTYSGGTEVDAGANLSISSASNIGSGALALVGSVSTPATLTTTADMTMANAISVTGDPIISVAPSTTFTVSTPITGTGDIEVAGGGTLALTAINTYTGPSIIDAGSTLVLSGSGSIATSSGVTNNGAFNITGKTTNVSVATYTQSATGTLAMNLAPTNTQQLNVVGAAVLAGGLSLSASSGAYTAGKYTLLTANGVTGTFGALNTNIASYTRLGYTLGYDANDVYLYFTPNVSDTQQSLVNTATVLQNTFALQNSVLANSFSYDCSVFGENNVCVSAGGRNTAVSAAHGLNNTSALLIAAYRVMPTVRIGAYADQNLSVNNAGSTVNLGNNTPLIGLFGAWNERLDGTGTEVKVSAAYGQKNTTVTRSVVGTSEPGSGSSQLNSQGAQVTVKYGFGLAENVVVSPYVGVRYSQNNMGGYTEGASSTVTAPLTYSALNTNATTALAGVGASYRFIPKATVFASAGVETDTNTANGTYIATGVTGLTPINFNANPVKTRPTATLGAYYDIVKNQRLGITGIYRQEAYQAVSTTTVMATYTVGL